MSREPFGWRGLAEALSRLVVEVAELTPDIVDACNNIRMGTRLFAKVYRIVVKWYGSEPPEALDDAIHLWMGGILRRQIGHSGAGHSKARGRRAEY
ncbi:hypothetical protein [Rhizobium rhizogenes]|uniref:hypothetical protein n=1 Tax=Rhizobium rhizogenes TaxID=359 RepID=UPI0012D2C3DB|nr:hypothetical protein [Rhizobium rhizogenes]